MLDAAAPLGSLELWMLDFLKVPERPQAPEGSPESIQIFHAGRSYFTFIIILWAIGNAAFLVLLLALDIGISRGVARLPEWIRLLWQAIVWFDLLAFAATLPLTFISQQLNYKLRWYMVTDRSLRIRSGIFSVEEMTMTFSNIQEIRVSANPLQNLLGIASVEVQSAGGGSDAKDSGHVGRFVGVSNANEIRDLMVERLRQYRDSGLGESAKGHPAGSPDSSDTLDAARRVLSEAQALRSALNN